MMLIKNCNGKSDLVVLFDREKATFMNIKSKEYLHSIYGWTSAVCSSDGKIGVLTPVDGGLEIIDLQNSRVKTMLPKRAPRGACQIIKLILDDRLIAYYNEVAQSVKVIRVRDARVLVNYTLPSALNCMESVRDRLVLGLADGTVCILLIADPDRPELSSRSISQLPSRNPTLLSLAPAASLLSTRAAEKSLAHSNAGTTPSNIS